MAFSIPSGYNLVGVNQTKRRGRSGGFAIWEDEESRRMLQFINSRLNGMSFYWKFTTIPLIKKEIDWIFSTQGGEFNWAAIAHNYGNPKTERDTRTGLSKLRIDQRSSEGTWPKENPILNASGRLKKSMGVLMNTNREIHYGTRSHRGPMLDQLDGVDSGQYAQKFPMNSLPRSMGMRKSKNFTQKYGSKWSQKTVTARPFCYLRTSTVDKIVAGVPDYILPKPGGVLRSSKTKSTAMVSFGSLVR